MRGQSHLHVIMSVMSYDSHECSQWWNRVAWHGAAQLTALSGWHRCQSLCGAPHLNLSTRLKWAKTVAVHLPSGSYVDWKSSDEIFQMCVNSICAFLTHHPSIFDVCLCAAVACFLGRLFELFIDWSLSKLWISYRFTVVRPHMRSPHPPHRMEHVGSRSLQFCFRRNIFDVVVPNGIKRTLFWGGYNQWVLWACHLIFKFEPAEWEHDSI